MNDVERAPAKVNLVLQVGPRRDDGLHEICSLFASLELADRVSVRPSDVDAVVCPDVPGPNLAQTALDAIRSRLGDRVPPLRVEIDKRIPIAAGLGGGSADAAAVLRAANALAGRPLDMAALRELGARVGADVPSQVEPGHALVTGAGEVVEPVGLPDMALVLAPAGEGLATAAVYAEADRIAATRDRLDPDLLRELASAPLERLASGLENDLERAALSLRPELEATLAALRDAGALATRITGSGPTAFAVFRTAAEAEQAAASLRGAIVTGLAAS